MQIQKPALVQRQELRLSPQLLQSIQILALPLMDLRMRIEEEVESNPALEVLEEKTTMSLDDVRTQQRSEDYDFSETGNTGLNFEGYDDEAGDNKRKFMEQALSRPESLQDHLIWQLRLQPLSEEHFQIGELLVRNLDENGFHRVDPETLIPEEKHGLMQRIMHLIQGFEPQGTCTRDYRESLVVQANLQDDVPEGTIEVIENWLELLDKGKFREIAKKLSIEEEDVEEILHFIKQLSPFPGRQYSNETSQYVIPDLVITRKENEIVVILNEEEIPVLGINPFFNEIGGRNGKPRNEEEQSKEVQGFVQGRLRDARWFINSLHMRNQTLLKVAYAIIEFQKDFFLQGPKSIVPLTLKDIAAEIEVHETTVSRLTNGKYVQTDWGLYELKYFFSSAVSGTKGETFSKEGVKQVLKELLQQEEFRNLSDQKLSEVLEAKGIKLARRTVTKYRKELDIDSSYDR